MKNCYYNLTIRGTNEQIEQIKQAIKSDLEHEQINWTNLLIKPVGQKQWQSTNYQNDQNLIVSDVEFEIGNNDINLKFFETQAIFLSDFFETIARESQIRIEFDFYDYDGLSFYGAKAIAPVGKANKIIVNGRLLAYDQLAISKIDAINDSKAWADAMDQFFNTKSEFEKDFYDQFEADLKRKQTKVKQR